MKINQHKFYRPGSKPSYCLLVLTLAFFFFICSAAFCGATNFHFNYNINARQAYQLVLNFKFKEAQNILDILKKDDPYNLVVHHIENYIDLFTIYSGEGGKSLKEFKEFRSHRLEMVKKGDEKSPYYLFVQAEIRLHSSLIRWKYSDYFGAFQDIVKANKLLSENEKLFPDFVANKKDLGILHAVIGTIPDGYKWSVKLIGGLNGTIEEGMKELGQVLGYAQKQDFVFKQETQILYALLTLYLKNKKEEAWKLINTYKLTPSESPLFCYIIATVAMAAGKNDQAIQVLSKKPVGKDFFPLHSLDFMLGLAKLRNLDLSSETHFKYYIDNFKGKILIKTCYQKLAWLEAIKGNKNGYAQLMQKCFSAGNEETEDDKQAMLEAEQKIVPHPALLKSRLLYDGGYLSKAKEILDKYAIADFSSKKDQLEFIYRKGRVHQGLNLDQSAINNYLQTINLGITEPYYFACNAALQIGYIYENQNQLEKAKYYYNRCLNIHPKEYRTSLHHQAKAGLNRIKK